MSYVGLAAMDEPVLVEMQNFLAANEEILTDRQKLWMAVGLAELGDFEGAWQIYRAMEEAFSESDGRLSYQSSNLDDTADTTAAALVLHSILGSDEADQLLSYLLWADQMDQMGRSTVPHLEILAYTKVKPAFLTPVMEKNRRSRWEVWDRNRSALAMTISKISPLNRKRELFTPVSTTPLTSFWNRAGRTWSASARW